ncbi:DNA polymerase III subunit gamma/tau [Gardnerella vaginalis]|jgi:DNA polymerase III, subunit gamma and tau|uniref:DNA polymerase III subunit gamma/tau n=1 Tax=Gardnerella TaxID=2701 RepID=UPI000353F771|nr:DNA polymerase III subunit gamma/tau [Gardnerella vaginalis]AYZ21178.1 DNA polymerase III subunit gamma/tau [Gardnerella vaginalis]EPI56862.1 DNA polymerase III, subunit gamma and tau [Gardnerella vaginalis JCP7276]NSX25381.1 DNA polymerase III subunit gamma/tau [Gardnerella vaginalis]NSX29163.1 DNA polymerase III subunit gamma/tau [Gardnerella vaginalis]OKY56141.1 DNA polymerase III subunit tau [Gardnerella vaginalis]
MALALYRRYRPDTFEGVIGQNQVTVPLMRALDQGKITHAYLFSGPRGCGKTSSARILARCINCKEGPTSKPCGKCQSCKDLATGGSGSIDVVEIDAASHNGVDDARELRERAGFAPARDRYKIFILDEAHMVTPQGFNALLKIVEEPPEHVMFIFATTEPDKVIGTIRSRTHHYPFRLVPPEVMGPYLQDICKKEGIQAQKGVLRLAMRAGGGSMRDTLSVLDQLMIGSDDGVISLDSAVALLGFTPSNLIADVIDALIEKDGAKLYEVVQKVVVGGFDTRKFVEDLLGRLRDLLLLVSAGPNCAKNLLGDLSPEDMQDLQRQSSQLTLRSLSKMAEIVNNAFAGMANAVSPRMNLEILMARLLADMQSSTTAQEPFSKATNQSLAKSSSHPASSARHFIGSNSAVNSVNPVNPVNPVKIAEAPSVILDDKSEINNNTQANWSTATVEKQTTQELDVDETWDNLVKNLPDDVREYVERDRVPKVRLDDGNASKRRLVLTFDQPISQHAFALAICTTEPYDGKKVPVVVMNKVKDAFGKNVAIAPDLVAANGEKVESVARMTPQRLAQVKRDLLMRKAGIVKGFGKIIEKSSDSNSNNSNSSSDDAGSSDDSSAGAEASDLSGSAISESALDLDIEKDDAWAGMGSAPMGDAIAALQNADFNAEVVNDSENADNAASNAQQWGQKSKISQQNPQRANSESQADNESKARISDGVNGAQEDECSMQDESLESATNLSIDDLEKMFEVKSVKEFAASDPKNPKNAGLHKRKQEE